MQTDNLQMISMGQRQMDSGKVAIDQEQLPRMQVALSGFSYFSTSGTCTFSLKQTSVDKFVLPIKNMKNGFDK